jgi:hypothetical protein
MQCRSAERSCPLNRQVGCCSQPVKGGSCSRCWRGHSSEEPRDATRAASSRSSAAAEQCSGAVGSRTHARTHARKAGHRLAPLTLSLCMRLLPAFAASRSCSRLAHAGWCCSRWSSSPGPSCLSSAPSLLRQASSWPCPARSGHVPHSCRAMSRTVRSRPAVVSCYVPHGPVTSLSRVVPCPARSGHVSHGAVTHRTPCSSHSPIHVPHAVTLP